MINVIEGTEISKIEWSYQKKKKKNLKESKISTCIKFIKVELKHQYAKYEWTWDGKC